MNAQEHAAVAILQDAADFVCTYEPEQVIGAVHCLVHHVAAHPEMPAAQAAFTLAVIEVVLARTSAKHDECPEVQQYLNRLAARWLTEVMGK